MSSIKRSNQNLKKIARLEFAEFLRGKRIEAGLTQSDVAKKLKFKNAQFISNIERGLAPVPFPTLKLLMKCYDMSFEELSEKYLELQATILQSELGAKKSA
ncbi:MAG: helix-turn-helix transcriptional regulator [Bdellovibrionota bacterium]